MVHINAKLMLILQWLSNNIVHILHLNIVHSVHILHLKL